jgi:hypothetical protein
MAGDQLRKLSKYRRNREALLFDLQWVRSMTGLTSLTIPDNLGLVDMGRAATTMLRERLWNRMTDKTYPNWITVDALEGSEMRGLVKAMNRCFVLKQCGDWVVKPRR